MLYFYFLEVLHIHTVPLRNTSGEKMASVQHPLVFHCYYYYCSNATVLLHPQFFSCKV